MAAVIVTKPASCPPETKGPHHRAGHFINPWESFQNPHGVLRTLFDMRHDWVSHPVPPPELLPQVIKPDWGLNADTSEAEKAAWKDNIKSTWLGHACFMLEFPAPPGSAGRGARVLFDPVFSNRCSPSQLIGPARVTKPPIDLKDLPEVDAVILSHNHYDHTDVTTLSHIYKVQPRGSVHFFAPLGNAKWFHSLGFSNDHVTELDWWQERDLSVPLPGGSETVLQISALPCQHFTGRGIHDRFKTLWASWAVVQLPTESSKFNSKVWFAGDTGYKSVPRGATAEEEAALPTCPAFKEIGLKFGGFDVGFIPIGAYEPRSAMSKWHCNPEDAVELHIDAKCKRSVGMHWGTWVLTCEEMTEPPKRLAAARAARGLSAADFDVCNIGETLQTSPSMAT